jgi:hypothetical protein
VKQAETVLISDRDIPEMHKERIENHENLHFLVRLAEDNKNSAVKVILPSRYKLSSETKIAPRVTASST